MSVISPHYHRNINQMNIWGVGSGETGETYIAGWGTGWTGWRASMSQHAHPYCLSTSMQVENSKGKNKYVGLGIVIT